MAYLMTVFSYDDFRRTAEEFFAKLPGLLSSHHTTVSLVPSVVDLLDVAETPFTLAIVGQMRVGKSSLLNALVGADLAVTGVTETTATINWFKHGNEAQCQRFRVVWKDRAPEEFPLDEIVHWVGDSQRAAATKYLEFFASVDFLRRANIVDTPGTRSAIESHEQATQEFLALKREQESQREGAAADAILYALMPVARQNDQDLLTEFESGSRISGSFPYNSLAVLHKWETLEVDNPLEEALEKGARMATRMADLVSGVVPVSAPLAIAAERFPDPFWCQLVDLANNSSATSLEQLLISDKYFATKSIPSCSLDPAARKMLRSQFKIPWPSLKFILRHAQLSKPGASTALREQILAASGITKIRDELERRFFSRAQMIKAFSLLAKAWEPCQIASSRLRNHKIRIDGLLAEADAARSCLEEQISAGVSALIPVREYIEVTRSLVEEDLRSSATTLRKLGEAQLQLKDPYEDMNADMQMLELLEKHWSQIGQKTGIRLRCLFGFRGPDVNSRIQLESTEGDTSITFDQVQLAICEVRGLQATSNSILKPIFEHAETRLEQIADWLDQQHQHNFPIA